MRYVLLSFALTLSACSLYQSDGRKFLEKEAFSFAKASASLQGCGEELADERWAKISSSHNADVYSSEELDYTLRVIPAQSEKPFSCTYRFTSVQEMMDHTEEAVLFTLDQMALSLVSESDEFAFREVSPLK